MALQAGPSSGQAPATGEPLDLGAAYAALRRQVDSLETEWREAGLLQEVDSLETEYLEEQTARELGIAGALALGLSMLHQTVKAVLPSQVAGPVIGGAWVLGGGFILFRLTAGTVAGWVGVMERNSRRKRQLRRKLEALELRLRAMLDTQAAMGLAAERGGGGGPPRRVSPSGSTGSSAELVEAPGDEERSPPPERRGAAAAARPGEGVRSWRRYASLGDKSKKP